MLQRGFLQSGSETPAPPSQQEGTVQTDLEVTKTLQVARAFAAALLSLSFSSRFSFSHYAFTFVIRCSVHKRFPYLFISLE